MSLDAIIAEKANVNKAERIDEKKAQAPVDQNALLYAFLQILESVKIGSDSVRIRSEVTEANAQAQEKIITLLAAVHYQVLTQEQIEQIDNAKNPSNSKVAGVLNGIQQSNEEVSKQQSFYTESIQTQRQNAQLEMTKINSGVNSVQQSMSEGSQILSAFQQITSQIFR